MRILKKEQGFTRTPKFGVTPKGGGFTLIELLVVVAIIGILASVILTNLSDAKNKGADAAIKSNLRNAVAQGEVFYATNIVAPDSYTNVCTNGAVGGANGIGSLVLAAAKARGLASYSTIIGAAGSGDLTHATCKESLAPASAWAAEVPLRTSGVMWCVDSTGKSKQENNISIGFGWTCL